ncbi:MAG: aminotransferase class III-fold pyridoxal phosphate-dependent enzyme, partial [Firmicutes bacterium]|nr:aminotransferase class III-fold pyridoxal phosphate-dependent enzyme [Bacillota bacterium]
SYMIIDETHTLSNGYGGCTKAWNLKPDFVTLGKSIAGGIPISVYGFTKEITEKIGETYGKGGVSDPMGIGGTLAANQFAIGAMRVTLKEVATEEAFEKMFAGQERLSNGLEKVLEKYGVQWSLTRSGARCEMQFMPTLPKNGTEAKDNFDWQLMYYMHIFLCNRGIFITPFHNMMLISPVTTNEDIDRLIQGWDDCIATLVEASKE